MKLVLTLVIAALIVCFNVDPPNASAQETANTSLGKIQRTLGGTSKPQQFSIPSSDELTVQTVRHIAAEQQSAALRKRLENVKPSLFGAISRKINSQSTNPVAAEVRKATIEYFKEFESSKTETKSVRRFPLVIDQTKFFGEPVIAKVDSLTDQQNDYYLVVLHFNVPTLNPAYGPIKYAFARFETKFVLYHGEPDDSASDEAKAQRAMDLKPVNIIAVFPVNEFLGVDRTDTNKLSMQLQPQYMGSSAGSITDEIDREEAYHMQLPTVISTATKYGDAAWLYYPARGQPLILGTKTAMAMIAVPKKMEDFKLRIQASLQFQLKAYNIFPLPVRRIYDCAAIDYTDCMKVDDLLALHSVDLPNSVKNTISDSFITSKPNYELLQAKSDNKDDYVFDKNAGILYRVLNGQLIPINVANSGQPTEAQPRK